MIPLAALAIVGCQAVDPAADRITAGDLAAAIPGFTAPAPAAPVGFAPAPGVGRVFRVPELRRIAASLRWGIEPADDICVERRVFPPDPAKFQAAMQKALPQAAISLLDYSRQQVPAGDPEFPLAGLRPGVGSALWTGWVRYGGNRRFPIWARVEVVVQSPRVIASADLRPGEAIAAGSVHSETREEFPRFPFTAMSAEDVVGKWPRVAIRAGTAIRADMLEDPKEIARGETVQVDVRNGAAHLEFEGKAEAAGAAGETIPVSNPTSHRRFLARVEGKGKVSVDVTVLKERP